MDKATQLRNALSGSGQKELLDLLEVVIEEVRETEYDRGWQNGQDSMIGSY